MAGQGEIMATVETLLTTEEFHLLPDDGQPLELVRGRVVVMNMPGFRHGEICWNAASRRHQPRGLS